MLVEWLLSKRRSFLARTYKVGGSQAIRIPKKVVDELRIGVGDEVFVLIRKRESGETISDSLGRWKSTAPAKPIYRRIREVLHRMEKELGEGYRSLRRTLTDVIGEIAPFLEVVSSSEREHFIDLVLVGLAYILDDLVNDALSILYTELVLTLDELTVDPSEYPDDKELYIVVEENGRFEVKRVKNKFIKTLLEQGKTIDVFETLEDARKGAEILEHSLKYYGIFFTQGQQK